MSYTWHQLMSATIPTLVVPTMETIGDEVDTRYRSLKETSVRFTSHAVNHTLMNRLSAISWISLGPLVPTTRSRTSQHQLLRQQPSRVSSTPLACHLRLEKTPLPHSSSQLTTRQSYQRRRHPARSPTERRPQLPQHVRTRRC